MSEPVGAAMSWQRARRVLARRMPGSVLVLTPGASEPLKLEGAAIFVWDGLRHPASDDDLVAAIASRFGLPADDVRDDVVTARQALFHHGAIVAGDD